MTNVEIMNMQSQIKGFKALAVQLRQFAEGRRTKIEILGETMAAKFEGQAESFERAATWIEEILK